MFSQILVLPRTLRDGAAMREKMVEGVGFEPT